METLVKTNSIGKSVTTSLIIAEIFGKEHNKVCRDIENLSCSDSFRVANFGEASFENSKTGQLHRMIELTKDGFSFLVMGYTGEKAGEFKETFINEFNKREDMLKSDDYILMRSQEILQSKMKQLESKLYQYEERIALQTNEIKAIAPKAEYYDTVLQSNETYVITRIAQELGISAVAMNKKLQDMKVQRKVDGQWMLYNQYVGNGYTKAHTTTYTKTDGTTGTNTQTVWTEKGREFIHGLFKSN